MTQALTIVPAESTAAIKPKPTRNEIIDAMTALRVQQIRTKLSELEEERRSLGAKIEAETRKHVQQNIKTLVPRVTFYDYSHCSIELKAEFSLSNIPPEISAMIVRCKELRKEMESIPKDAKVIRRKIKDAVSGNTPNEERVTALLTDKESRKALETALQKIAA